MAILVLITTMNEPNSGECMLWSNSGAWLQVVENGQRRLSFVGQTASKVAIECWCRDRGIPFIDVSVSKAQRRHSGAFGGVRLAFEGRNQGEPQKALLRASSSSPS